MEESKRVKRPSTTDADFVNACDKSNTIQEVSSLLGIKDVSVYQRYRKLQKQFPGIFINKLKNTAVKRDKDILASIAKMRGQTKEELEIEMEDRLS